MTAKIYVNEDNTGTFVCPKCQKTSVKDLSRYMAQKTAVRLKARCACGHAYEVFLEKRKKFRKPANLPGSYRSSAIDSGPRDTAGSMIVKDLSYSGLRIEVGAPPLFTVGDSLYVEFRLDDTRQSQVRKKVIVKNIEGLCVGLAFASLQNNDSALGFYLFS
ncbi:MAG: hypothetical protein COX19_08365 [Desulfobacterales bacterium CG23_combo_of_CG06-09_8_20_14_all_51_8]|nr:MAG: hypothetical protein COX19_08365 [Desulfobacterales bacterium CG23_combo_of_CG06-09_8_20_14_all_51_8]